MSIYKQALKLAAKTFIVKEAASNEVAAERMAICSGCEHMNHEEIKCGVCGCFLDLKTASAVNWNPAKMRNEITHCPLGKWGDIQTANTYRQIDGKQLLTTK